MCWNLADRNMPDDYRKPELTKQDAIAKSLITVLHCDICMFYKCDLTFLLHTTHDFGDKHAWLQQKVVQYAMLFINNSLMNDTIRYYKQTNKSGLFIATDSSVSAGAHKIGIPSWNFQIEIPIWSNLKWYIYLAVRSAYFNYRPTAGKTPVHFRESPIFLQSIGEIPQ